MDTRPPLPPLHDLPRGLQGQASFQPPDARWLDRQADGRDIAHSTLRPGYIPQRGNGLLLGEWDDEFIGTEDDRHVMTVAGSRSGKGVSNIIPNLIFYRGSMLVIDPKGENANITARRRAHGLAQTVHVLDPFGITADYLIPWRASFNPMAFLTPPDSPHLVADAALIADALVIVSGTDSHWDDTARNFIEGLILHVATADPYDERRDLVTVRDLLMNGTHARDTDGTEKTGMAGLRLEMERNPHAGGAIQSAAHDLFEKPPGEQGSVLSTARRHTKFLDIPPLQDVLRHHSFDLTTLKDAPTTIYLCLPASRLSMCARWFRLFINLTIEAMERNRTKPPLPVVLVLDEFAVLGHMPIIEAAAGQIAGFGCKLHVVLQDLGQLKALYHDRYETFMGNAGVLQFFGNNDLYTLEWLTRRLGQTSITVRQAREITARDQAHGLMGENTTAQQVPLLAPDEAARYVSRATGRQIIILPELRPLMLRRCVYHTDPLFEGLYDKAPETL